MLSDHDSTGRRFADAVVLVSGVSDRGIGGAIIERLADEGANVVVTWLATAPDRVLRRLRRSGAAHVACPCDVTDQQSVQAAVDACLARFGRIDVLVNNAGVETTRDLESLGDDEWQHTLDVNLTGAMRLTRAVLPHLSTDGGVVVNIASVLALAGSAQYSAYAASKAGLVGLTQSLALELAPRRQRAVCIAPALVYTPMVTRHIATMTEAEKRQTEATHPLGIGQPQDVAAAVAFLASQDARWVTGVTLPMGWLSGYQLPALSPQTLEPERAASADQSPPPVRSGLLAAGVAR